MVPTSNRCGATSWWGVLLLLLGLDFLGGFVYGFLGERRLRADGGTEHPAVSHHDPIHQTGSIPGPRLGPGTVRPPRAPDDRVGLREPASPKPEALPKLPEPPVVEPPEPEELPTPKIVKSPIDEPAPPGPEKAPGLPEPDRARGRMLAAADKLHNDAIRTFGEALDRNSRRQLREARQLMDQALRAYREALRKYPGDEQIKERIRLTNAARYRMMKSTGF